MSNTLLYNIYMVPHSGIYLKLTSFDPFTQEYTATSWDIVKDTKTNDLPTIWKKKDVLDAVRHGVILLHFDAHATAAPVSSFQIDDQFIERLLHEDILYQVTQIEPEYHGPGSDTMYTFAVEADTVMGGVTRDDRMYPEQWIHKSLLMGKWEEYPTMNKAMSSATSKWLTEEYKPLPQKMVCNCDSFNLFNYGCKCGAMAAERKVK